ncbi:hypothetical protein HK105_208809 [Polyrhizophydium stewartii]|uniref:GH26 domain-containing protein n=1 Tax=Polyrhizophydium stewartii TaxID=2732419 RepID=A0ABR4MWS8_9FUNG
MRRALCACLFWTKATLALLLSMSGLGYMVWKIYVLHRDAVSNSPVLGPVAIDATRCLADATGLSRLEPSAGRLLVGFHLDWSKQTPKDIRTLAGFAPAVTNAFMRLDPSLSQPFDYDLLTWHVWQVSLVGGIFELTIEPMAIDTTSDAILDQLAQTLRDLNSKYGVPILLRYGHEMNGDWTVYGYKPAQYKSGFIKMAKLVRQYTNMTAMVWAPNLGVTYPFIDTGSVSTLPTAASDPTNFALLDTNGDGKITSLDDPYGPYYPGDEYVDWVGLSLYWYPDATTGYNAVPPSGYFTDMLHGSGTNALNSNPLLANDNGLHDFYGRFAHAKSKPFLLPETSAPYISSQTLSGSVTELAIKQTWWQQIFVAAKDMPLFKIAVFFEELKVDDQVRDWRMLANSTVRPAFLADQTLGGTAYAHAEDLKFTCAGAVTFSS